MIWGSIWDDPVAELRALVTQTGFMAYKPDNSGANDAVPAKV